MKTRLNSLDGHLVRSRCEVIIDDWLHYHNIKHDYEKPIFFSPTGFIICDWYLPNLDIYLEYWGVKKNSDYTKNRLFKEEIYKKLNLTLISIENSDLTCIKMKLGRLEYLKLRLSQQFLNQTTNVSLSKLISLRLNTRRPLKGSHIVGCIAKPLKIGYTNNNKKYGLIHIQDANVVLKVQIWADYDQKNLNIVSDLSTNSTICIINPIIPPKDFHSSDLWVNETYSSIMVM